MKPNGGNIKEPGSFKLNARIPGRTSDAVNIKDVKIAVPLKYLSKFWRTSKMILMD